MKNKKPLIYIAGLILFFAGMIFWSKSLQKNDPDIIVRSGMHWHPELSIYSKGEKQLIPPNLNAGFINTHDSSGKLHLEASGIVRKKDIKVDSFFKAWDKEFNSFGENVIMTVNGVENAELGNYVIEDGDKIELRYE